MRKSLIATALAGSLALAGCGTTTTNTLPTSLDTLTTTFIADAQAAAADACKVIPTVASIVSIFNAGIGTTIAGVTAAVCSVAPPPASARFGALPTAGTGSAAVVLGNIPSTTIQVTGWKAGTVRFGHVYR